MLNQTKDVGGGYIKGGATTIFRINQMYSSMWFHLKTQTLMEYSLTVNTVNPDLQNEEITSVELGYGFIGNNFGKM